VKLIKVSREKGHELLEKYDAVNSEGADAILDIAIFSLGFATVHPVMSPPLASGFPDQGSHARQS
jgi:hypothetical protein